MEISVAMCTYGGEEYVASQLESILEQTRSPDEIIVFDDGSSDSTYDIVTEYAEKYPDVIDPYQNTENVGVIENFERCIRQCTGDVIALSDQDDIWHEEKLERQLAIFQEEDVRLVFHNSNVVTASLEPKGDLWSSVTPPYKTGSIQSPEDAVKELLERNVVQGATAMFDSALREICLPIPEQVPHDHHIALVAAATGGIREIDEELLDYRQHTEQATGLDQESRSLFRSIAESLTRNHAEFEEAKTRLRAHRSALQTIDDEELVVDRDFVESEIESRLSYFHERRLVYDESVGTPIRLRAVYRLLTRGLYRLYGDGMVSAFRDVIEIVATGIDRFVRNRSVF